MDLSYIVLANATSEVHDDVSESAIYQGQINNQLYIQVMEKRHRDYESTFWLGKRRVFLRRVTLCDFAIICRVEEQYLMYDYIRYYLH